MKCNFIVKPPLLTEQNLLVQDLYRVHSHNPIHILVLRHVSRVGICYIEIIHILVV